jgi:hypothetical protein
VSAADEARRQRLLLETVMIMTMKRRRRREKRLHPVVMILYLHCEPCRLRKTSDFDQKHDTHLQR